MNGRERILTALDGGTPDGVPCALNFYRARMEALSPPGYDWSGRVDVQFVAFPASPEDEALRDLGRPHTPDTRLGNFTQLSTYARWHYRPGDVARRNPLARATSLEDLRAFPFPDVSQPYHVAGLKAQVEELHAQGMAAGGTLPHLGGELFESAWRLRGLENFLLDLKERPEWAHYLLDRLMEMACRNVETLARAGIDVLALGDDVGMPVSMMLSPATWDTFFKPRMARIIAAARAIKPDVRVVFHSDGNFAPLIPALLEIGVDGINPVQPDHMDAVALRKQYGPELAFWGTVGYQTTFSFGEPATIAQEVHTRVATLGRAGLILSPTYDIDEPDIPWRNIAAFLDAAAVYR